MVVTEKCDVYSFGVVALELVLGKHPADLLSLLSSSTYHNIKLKDVIDPRVPLLTDQQSAQSVASVETSLAKRQGFGRSVRFRDAAMTHFINLSNKLVNYNAGCTASLRRVQGMCLHELSSGRGLSCDFEQLRKKEIGVAAPRGAAGLGEKTAAPPPNMGGGGFSHPIMVKKKGVAIAN
ncbi:hypothetical protein Sjap_015758 [Stephania japonica]|uniref:non-specific serine/threonine protein kinase n=1 Tax=Stephania japonica TaxID=461633 RepID=A0AAP0IJQ3_9MAGN